jgi:class 3 adenylate cyclase
VSRATATVLFTDLVGSTEVRGRLGEEAADELRRRHDQLLTQAVEANNGRVVKGLGDGIMATFGGASDGVAAAVAIQQGIDRLNRTGKAPAPLSVRVGLSAGDVTFEDDDVHGTPVIEASRLCGVAAGGEILAADLVRALVGSATAAGFASVGPRELKGLAHALPAVRVEWEPAAASTVPLPALLTDVGRIFVGREPEFERLGQLWKEAVAGERRVVLLAGEPGVGKTRLAAELAVAVHDQGGIVLAGRCDEDLGVPYQPFVEALRHFVDHTASEGLPQRLGRYGGELVRLVPELAQRVPDLPPPLKSDPETERYRLFDAMAGWLAAMSAEEPALVVLDDLQWAARPTLLLLGHVARSPDLERVLVVGTYRDTELGHDHPLVEVLADLRREGGVAGVSLTGFDPSGVAAYMEAATGHPLDGEELALARAIHEETEGNPFFVREVLRHLAETGAIERREGRWATRLPVDELGIPEGVRDVVGRRLSRLSGDTNQVLRVAAVVGAEFEWRVVQSAGGVADEALLATVEEAIGARLVTEASAHRYRFSHALLRATLYESLTAARKAALHRKVAGAIESVHAHALEDHLPALAYHWARAVAPAAGNDKAVDYAARAGDRALAQLANDEAARYYGQALELLGPARSSSAARRCHLLISLGEAQRRAGDPCYRETLLDAARLAEERGDGAALGRAALANSRGVFSITGGVDTERVAVLEAALAAHWEGDAALRARLLANLAGELLYAPDQRRRFSLSEEAVAIAEVLDDPATLAHVLLARAGAILGPDSIGERHETALRLIPLAERLGDPSLAAMAWWHRTVAALEAAQREEAERSLEACEVLSADLGQPNLRVFATLLRFVLLLIDGRFEESERLADHFLELARAAGWPDFALIHAAITASVRYEQGQLGELEEEIARAAAANPGFGSFQAYFALVYCEIGQDDQARAVLAGLAGRLEALPREHTWLRAQVQAAAASAHLKDRALATRWYDVLAPYAGQAACTSVAWWGALDHYLGMLATTLRRFDEASAHFSAAEATHRRMKAPAWLARTRLEWARMLLTRRQLGDTERAGELLGQALDSARELGLAKVERRAVELRETV